MGWSLHPVTTSGKGGVTMSITQHMHPARSRKTDSHPQLLFLLFVLFETESPYEAQAGLKLLSFLPQPPEFWDYRYAPPCPASKCFSTSRICPGYSTQIFTLQVMFTWVQKPRNLPLSCEIVSSKIHCAQLSTHN
jgi:hypothetical protein